MPLLQLVDSSIEHLGILHKLLVRDTHVVVQYIKSAYQLFLTCETK